METLIFSVKFFLKVVGIVAASSSGMNNQTEKTQIEPQKAEPIELVYQKQDTVQKDTLNINLNASVRSVEVDDVQIKKIS